jgi:hypothetical protein
MSSTRRWAEQRRYSDKAASDAGPPGLGGELVAVLDRPADRELDEAEVVAGRVVQADGGELHGSGSLTAAAPPVEMAVSDR